MKKIAITGIANCGKTTLFNGLTGKNERVGNWFGVTTEEVFAKVIGLDIVVYDLPGSYFDGDFTLEQKKAKQSVKDKDCIILVAEAANLKKGLDLLKKISVYNSRILLVINMYAELKRGGGHIDFENLQRLTGVNVVLAEVNTKAGINAVKRAISGLIENADTQNLQKIDIKKINTEEILNSCFVAANNGGNTAADKIFLNGFISCPLFLIIFFTVLYLAFGKYGVGNILSYFIEFLYEYAVNRPIALLLMAINVNDFIFEFIISGISGGILSVIVFLPKLAVINLFLTFIEESGILARIAYMFDFVFSWAGLTGRAVFMLLTGYGCTAAGVLCSGGLENECIKKRAICGIPFIPCSAKIPVFLYIISIIGMGYGFLAVAFVFILGFLLSLFACFVQEKFSKIKTRQYLIIEFPPYRFPKIKTLLKSLQKFVKGFIIRIGTIVALTTAFLWLLSSVACDFLFVKVGDERSILAVLAKKTAFLFAPAGIGDWRLIVSLICGLFAKESVISSLSIFGLSDINIAKWLCFIAFFALYPPCVTAMATIGKELGKKCAAMLFITYFLLAYLVAALINLWCISWLSAILACATIGICVIIYYLIIKHIFSQKIIHKSKKMGL